MDMYNMSMVSVLVAPGYCTTVRLSDDTCTHTLT